MPRLRDNIIATIKSNTSLRNSIYRIYLAQIDKKGSIASFNKLLDENSPKLNNQIIVNTICTVLDLERKEVTI